MSEVTHKELLQQAAETIEKSDELKALVVKQNKWNSWDDHVQAIEDEVELKTQVIEAPLISSEDFEQVFTDLGNLLESEGLNKTLDNLMRKAVELKLIDVNVPVPEGQALPMFLELFQQLMDQGLDPDTYMVMLAAESQGAITLHIDNIIDFVGED